MPRLLMVPLLLLTLVAGAEPMKQPLTVELFYNSVWNDHSIDVYTRDGVSIVHAAGNEQSGLVPSEASLTFQGRDGRMNPANIRSPLHGLIGRNTPIRITVGSVRLSGQVVSWKPRRAVKGDAWVHVVAGGHLRQLGQGDPLALSASHRTILHSAPVAAWLMEDGSEASAFGSALSGGTPMVVTAGAEPGASSPVHWIPAMAQLTITAGAVGTMRAAIGGAQPTGDIAFGFGYQLVAGTETFSQVLIGAANGLRWRVYIDDLFDELVVEALDASGPIAGVGGWSTALVDGGLHHVMATIEQSGADAAIAVYIDGIALSLSGSTISAVTVAAPVAAEVGWQPGTPPPTQQAGELRIGSLAVWDTLPAPATISGALHGFVVETAGARFTRLGVELGITTTIVGSAAETQPMGPQPTDTTLGLLGEIARTDNALIFDTRSQLGLTFRTGRSLYNQS